MRLFVILCATLPLMGMSLGIFPRMMDAYALQARALWHPLVLYFLLYGACLVLLPLMSWRGREVLARSPEEDRPALERTLGRLVLVFGLFMVWCAMPWEPWTTHDLQRYLWDGNLLALGHDPYVIKPADAPLAELLKTWHVAPEHQAYGTLYPPLALGLFAAASLLGPSVFLWKVLCALGLSALLVFAYGHLVARGRGLALVWLVAHPLFLLEAAYGAHVDLWVGLFWVLAVFVSGAGGGAGSGGGSAAFGGRPFVVGGLLGLGVLTKLSPLVLGLPLLLLRRWRILAGLLVTVCVVYGAVLLLGYRPWGSTGVFASQWRFGSLLGTLLQSVLPGRWVSPVAAGLGLLGFTWLGFRLWRDNGHRNGYGGTGQWRLPEISAVFFGVVFLSAPMVFPWYLLVLLPPLVFSETLSPHIRWPLMALTLLQPLTHEVLWDFFGHNIWQPALWPLGVVAAGLVVAYGAASRWAGEDVSEMSGERLRL